jgi:hypothetical protein
MDFDPIIHRKQIQVASGLDFLAGIWLIAAPFALHFQNVRNAAAIDGFFGVLIALLAGVRIFAYMFPSISWFNVVFGIWIVVSPFFLGFYHFHTALVTNILSGIAVIILATWSALLNKADPHYAGPDRKLADIASFPPGD